MTPKRGYRRWYSVHTSNGSEGIITSGFPTVIFDFLTYHYVIICVVYGIAETNVPKYIHLMVKKSSSNQFYCDFTDFPVFLIQISISG